jgi:hypothetical protein
MGWWVENGSSCIVIRKYDDVTHCNVLVLTDHDTSIRAKSNKRYQE